MPNHIQNRLKVVGEPTAVAELFYKIENIEDPTKARRIDFNKILEIPEDLNIDEENWLSELSNPYMRNSFRDTMHEIRAFSLKNPDRPEIITNFLKGVNNFIKFGHATWYSWCIKNWGTKWNAYDESNKLNTHDTIYFNTAWNAPIPVLKELSKQFPDLVLELAYADEDSGSNAGTLKLAKGEIIEQNIPESQSKEAYDLCFELHPDKRKYFNLVDGKYEYKDTEDDE